MKRSTKLLTPREEKILLKTNTADFSLAENGTNSNIQR